MNINKSEQDNELLETMREKLARLIRDCNNHPEKTCPHFYSDISCEGCPYNKGAECNQDLRKADYLIRNGVIIY